MSAALRLGRLALLHRDFEHVWQGCWPVRRCRVSVSTWSLSYIWNTIKHSRLQADPQLTVKNPISGLLYPGGWLCFCFGSFACFRWHRYPPRILSPSCNPLETLTDEIGVDKWDAAWLIEGRTFETSQTCLECPEWLARSNQRVRLRSLLDSHYRNKVNAFWSEC